MDIEASTSLLKRLGRERYGELMARHQVLLREAFAAHGGELIGAAEQLGFSTSSG